MQSGSPSPEPLPAPLEFSLQPWTSAPPRIRVEFRTPMDLKSDGKRATNPEFGILMRRIRDRVHALQAMYGPEYLSIDFRGFGERAARVRTAESNLRKQDGIFRQSSSGHRHPLGGWIGSIVYEGDLREFLPFLEVAKWTGVGRHTVWGNGVIDWLPPNSE
jgi:hypothetical protein